MIIVNGFVFHVSTIVVLFGAYYASQSSGFAEAYKYIEKIQMTGFTLQEFILSGLYVWKTLDIIRATSNTSPNGGPMARKRRTSRIMWQLFSINVFIVFMDVAVLVIEYQDRHVFQQALKEVVYSIKLKMEFAILSKLVALTSKDGGSSGANFTGAFEDYRGTEGPGSASSKSDRSRTDASNARLSVLANPSTKWADGIGEVRCGVRGARFRIRWGHDAGASSPRWAQEFCHAHTQCDER